MSIPQNIRRMVVRVGNQLAGNMPVPEEALVALYQALGEHLGRPTRRMTMEQNARLWAGVHDYVRACRGEPERYVYGNTPRQRAVVAVEDVLRELAVGWRPSEMDKALESMP